MSRPASVVVEFFGEGKTDIGTATEPSAPTEGVVPILVHAVCGKPENLLAVRRPLPFLPGKGFWQKVWFAKRQASYNGSRGVVFVVDSEGGAGAFKSKKADLEKGRSHGLPDYPMAVGVAQPCIEAWLLSDPAAIQKALRLAGPPPVPADPESLPAPQQDRANNPKTALATAAGGTPLSARDKDRIAAAMHDFDLARQCCPLGFAPFADEVAERIAPLF